MHGFVKSDRSHFVYFIEICHFLKMIFYIEKGWTKMYMLN